MKKAISLLSGGMDSLVTLALAMQEYEVYPLHVNYGNRTGKKELHCYRKIVGHYALKGSLEVDIDYLARIGGSSLTDSSIKPEIGIPKAGEIPSSYVPFRNTHLLSIAVSYAEVLGASKIFIGAVEEDSSGYPDCTKKYIASFNELIRVGSKAGGKIEVTAPLIDLTKSAIVKKGLDLRVPFEHTWSCYVGNEKACGRCQSCYLRQKGFRDAGARDPVQYEKFGD